MDSKLQRFRRSSPTEETPELHLQRIATRIRASQADETRVRLAVCLGVTELAQLTPVSCEFHYPVGDKVKPEHVKAWIKKLEGLGDQSLFRLLSFLSGKDAKRFFEDQVGPLNHAYLHLLEYSEQNWSRQNPSSFDSEFQKKVIAVNAEHTIQGAFSHYIGLVYSALLESFSTISSEDPQMVGASKCSKQAIQDSFPRIAAQDSVLHLIHAHVMSPHPLGEGDPLEGIRQRFEQELLAQLTW